MRKTYTELKYLYRSIIPKSVNAYVVRDKERNLIIDAGLQDDMCMNTIQADLSHPRYRSGKNRFFHYSWPWGPRRSCSQLIHSGSVVYLNRLEADFIQKMESGVFFQEIQEHYRMSGFPEGDFEKIIARIVRRNFISKDMPRFQFLKDGDTLVKGRLPLCMCRNTRPQQGSYVPV